jgi:hypothetical protein
MMTQFRIDINTANLRLIGFICWQMFEDGAWSDIGRSDGERRLLLAVFSMPFLAISVLMP